MTPENAIHEIVLRIGWSEVSVAVLCAAALQFLLGLWIKARLETSIKSEADRRMEEFRLDIRKREQATKIAELLAAVESKNKRSAEELNAMVWALALWLPPDILKNLMKCLMNSPGAKDPKQLILDVRAILHQKREDISPEDLVHYE